MNRKDEHLKLALEYHKENTYSDFDKISLSIFSKNKQICRLQLLD